MAAAKLPKLTIKRETALDALRARIADLMAEKTAYDAACTKYEVAKAEWMKTTLGQIGEQLSKGALEVERLDVADTRESRLLLRVTIPAGYMRQPEEPSAAHTWRQIPTLERFVRLLALSSDENVSVRLVDDIADYL